MVPQSRYPSLTVPDDPRIRTYGSLFALLAATVLLQRLASVGVWALSSSVPETLDPQLVGTVVYATLALAALLAVDVARRRLWPATVRFDPFERRSIGVITALLLLLVAYVLHGALDLPAFPEATVRTLLIGPVALGLPAVVYATAYGLELHTALPAREEWYVVAGVVTVTTLVSAALWPVTSILTGLPDGMVAARQPLTPLAVLWEILLPTLFVGVGWGVLYNGVVQPRLREHLDPAGAVAVLTTLVTLLYWVRPAAARVSFPFSTTVVLLGVVLLSLLLAPAFARLVRHGVESLDHEWRPLSAGVASAIVAALLVVLTTRAGLTGSSLLSWGIGYSVAAAAAAVGYERTRSLWVPVAVYASFVFFTDIHVGQFLIAALP